MKTTLMLGLLLMSTILLNSASAAELFVVHAHRHYIKTNYSSMHNNPFTRSLKEVQQYFCDKELKQKWVYDKRFWPRRDFPISRCGSQKLISAWGSLYVDNLELDQNIVLTGIYFGNCVSATYRSISYRFLDAKNMPSINIHFALPATIGYYGKDFSNAGISKIIKDEHFLKVHELVKNTDRKHTTEIYNNGVLEKTIPPAEASSGKTIRIYLWGDIDQMLKTI